MAGRTVEDAPKDENQPTFPVLGSVGWLSLFLECVNTYCAPECPVPEGPWAYECYEHSVQIDALWQVRIAEVCGDPPPLLDNGRYAIAPTYASAMAREDKRGYVYVIGQQALEYGQLVKLGSAASPQDRLGQLQTGSPVLLVIHAQLATADRYELEARVHARFAHLRAHREWFTYGPELAAFIAWADQQGSREVPTAVNAASQPDAHERIQAYLLSRHECTVTPCPAQHSPSMPRQVGNGRVTSTVTSA